MKKVEIEETTEVVVNERAVNFVISEVRENRRVINQQSRELHIFNSMLELGLRNPKSNSYGESEDFVFKLEKSIRGFNE